MEQPQSTAPNESSARAKAADVAFRVTMLALLILLVTLGASSLLGVRSAMAVDEKDGYRLAVEHASVSRPGLATPFEVTVTRSQGLPSQLALEVTSSYLAAFDENGLSPAPVESYADSDVTRWVFAVPAGATELVVSFDARLEPAVQWTRSATVGLVVEGKSVTKVGLTTWVAP